MRNLATVIANLLPPETAEEIRQITGDRELAALDERMHPVVNPELPKIARVLPANTAYQITRVAERLGLDEYSEVLTEVANSTLGKSARPKDVPDDVAPRLASASFPPCLTASPYSAEPAAIRFVEPGSRTKLRK